MRDPDPKDERIPIGPLDCAGVYGRLTVLSVEGTMANCLCTCGTRKSILMRSLRSGNTRSCGCLGREARAANGRRNRTHGMKRTSTYKSWDSMKQRCLNPKSRQYRDYGGRGISICARWVESFENFLADMGECPPGLTLERKDVNGHYEPSNCTWATRLAQTRNRRITAHIKVDGQDRILGEVCAERGVNAHLVHGRLRSGWPINERLFSQPRVPESQASRR